ncbi:MAG: signal peptidase I [Planctomycetota bacterium]|nr:MAG: signal peptidase I [Planctomycetota bacterium]
MSKKKQAQPQGPLPSKLRELVESLAMAVLMAIGLKYFLVEAYSIPSPSMQPTLLGSNAAGAYDRILVNKAAYLLRAPQRWEIAVFRYPHNRSQNYVKRIVGLPGETLQIIGGDIYRRDAEGKLAILRKPKGLQDAFWRRIWHQDLREDPRADLGRSVHWDGDEIVLAATGSTTKSILLGNRESLRDHYWHGYPPSIEEAVKRDLGSPDNGYGRHSVGDLRISGELQLSSGWKRAFLRIAEQDSGQLNREIDLEITNKAGKSFARLSISGDGSRLEGEPTSRHQSQPVEIEAGTWIDMELWHWDDQIWAHVGGVELGPLPYSAPAVPLNDEAQVVARVGVSGAGARLRGLQLDRDQYYLAREAAGTDIKVPAHNYWMLGDNTQNSADGRSWATLSLSYDPKTKKLLRPGTGSARLVGNARVGSGDADENPVFVPEAQALVFTDLQGEEHVLKASYNEFLQMGYGGLQPRNDGGEGAQRYDRFVPEQYFLGRALAIFWPLGLGSPFRLSLIR